jgi:hypothetical protein
VCCRYSDCGHTFTSPTLSAGYPITCTASVSKALLSGLLMLMTPNVWMVGTAATTSGSFSTSSTIFS